MPATRQPAMRHLLIRRAYCEHQLAQPDLSDRRRSDLERVLGDTETAMIGRCQVCGRALDDPEATIGADCARAQTRRTMAGVV